MTRRIRNGPEGNRKRRSRYAVWACALAALLPGCVRERIVERPGLSRTVVDPTAARLHDLCGALLRYCAEYGSLPVTLAPIGERLYGAAGGEKKVAAFKYFNPAKALQGRPGDLVVLAPPEKDLTLRGRPARWAILLSPLKPGAPVTAQVVLLYEEEIQKALRAPKR